MGILARATGQTAASYSPEIASGRWEFLNGPKILRVAAMQIRALVVGAAVISVAEPITHNSSANSTLAVPRSISGLYERVADSDGRPAYRQESPNGTLRFVYSNRHGDWRVFPEERGVGSAIAHCPDVLAQRAEDIRSSWQIFNGTTMVPAMLQIAAVKRAGSNQFAPGIVSWQLEIAFCVLLLLVTLFCFRATLSPHETDTADEDRRTAKT